MTRNRSGLDSYDDAQGSFPEKSNRQGKSPAEGDDIAILSTTMLTRLSRTIESEIVPRLMMAFEAAQSAVYVPETSDSWSDPVSVLDLDIDEFVHLLLTQDAAVACEYVKTLRTDGVPLPTIYLDLLAPSARRLGEMWEHDECSFTDVTIGVCRMHQVLLDFSRCFEPRDKTRVTGRSALIVPAPGEQHTFGLFLVVEFLRRAGWHCWTGTPATMRDLHRMARDEHFDVIGLSVSAERNLGRLAERIDRIRDFSVNPDVKVLLGGFLFNDQPELAVEHGADGFAKDGQDAVRVLNRICVETGNSSSD
jgi:methanogenic corrinoid protein MtbC1